MTDLRESVAKALYERGAAMHYGTVSWAEYPHQQAFLDDADAMLTPVREHVEAMAGECVDEWNPGLEWLPKAEVLRALGAES